MIGPFAAERRLIAAPRRRLPSRFASRREELPNNDENRLYVAASEKWIGYFVLKKNKLRPEPTT